MEGSCPKDENIALFESLKSGSNKFPAKIPPEIFRLALLSTISNNIPTLEGIKDAIYKKVSHESLGHFYNLLKSILAKNPDLEELNKSIDLIYNKAIERVEASYKRTKMIFSFSLALIIASVFNLDSIEMARSMWEKTIASDKIDASIEMVSKNLNFSNGGKFLVESRFDSIIITVDSNSKKPILLSKNDSLTVNEQSAKDKNNSQRKWIYQYSSRNYGIPFGWSNENMPQTSNPVWVIIVKWITKLFGILITVFMIAIGISFWLEILNKLSVWKK